MTSYPPLDLHADPIDLTAALVDIPSVSQDESVIADAVEAALREQTTGFEIVRNGNAVLARPNRGLRGRVILAGVEQTPGGGYALTYPRRLGFGLGETAVSLSWRTGDDIVVTRDVTLVFYDCEEIEATKNGLGRIERELPQWLQADVAILGEPTGGFIEAGCQGTLRVRLTAGGTRAHSARSWLGDNAIHKFGAVLNRLAGYQARDVDIDGCVYREGLQAVRIAGGVAGNVVPDVAELDVNFRFAPDRSVEQALDHVREVVDGLGLGFEITDASAGALPGLHAPAAAALIDAAGGNVRAKYGWTDVSRFSALGIPAVNYGPGDPNLAHKRDERVPTAQITDVTRVLRGYLTAG